MLITTKEAAEKLGKSRQYIWSLIMMKRIKAKKIGKQYLIKDKAITKLLHSQENQSEDRCGLSNLEVL